MSNKYKFDKSDMLLTKENNTIEHLVGERRESLATVIAQVYKCVPRDDYWSKECSGVLCFIKDHPAKSYYFRMYCMYSSDMVWEHEVYQNIQYLDIKNFFHMFEGEEYLVGFNFASEAEAKKFKTKVHEKFSILPTKTVKQKTLEKKTKKKTTKSTKKTRTELVIGSPIDFIHLTHVGMDGNWNIDKSDTYVEDILKHAFSISKTSTVDRATQEFAVEFIKKKISKKRRAPPPPPQQNSSQPPKPPSVPLPPKQTSSPPSINIPSINIPPPPPIQNIPPPPPMSNIPAPPPIQNMLQDPSKLNIPVSPVPSRPSSPVPSIPSSPLTSHRFDDPRSELFNSIRSGKHKLKSSKDRELEPKVEDEADFKNDIAKALAVALQKRGKFIKDSDSSDDNNANSDEWED